MTTDEPDSAEPTRPPTNDGDAAAVVAVKLLSLPSETLPSNGRYASSALVETSQGEPAVDPGRDVDVPPGAGVSDARPR